MTPAPKRGEGWTCDCGTFNGSDRRLCIGCGQPPSPNSIAPFEFHTGQIVRTVIRGGAPWFVAKDVCAVLGIGNHRQAISYLDDDERGVITNDTPGGEQQTAVVNEPGLYSLILRSRKPEARAFKRWITHEVLPVIRRTGSYGAPRFEVPRTLPEALRAYAAEVEARELAERRAAELEPDASRALQTLDANGLCLVGTVAKRFGLKEKGLREFLYAEGLLIRNGTRRNEPYARYIESGHFELKTRLVDVHPDRAPEERSTTYVTPKGEALIWKRLYAVGVVSSPTMPGVQLAIGGA